MADPSGTPSSVFKHAINLNRYGSGVSKKLMIAYNRIVVNATKELQAMSSEDYSSSYRAKRLRQIIGSLKTSLDGWAGDATKFMTKDLDELAKIESEFVLAQFLQEIPDADGLIRELEISPQFAKAVVTKDPTELNLVTTEAGDSLTGKGVYKLTAKQGTPMVLPNGDTVEKAFRGIANTSAQKFRLVVQDGMLTGLSTDKIVRQIIGRQGGMKFATGQNISARALSLAGGEKGTRLANHQIMSLVRTSINQVSNTASQETYKANSAITKKYRYVATLDSNTTLLCASKDGKLFDYEEGPMPPLHFNCRSTTVPVIDWDGLEKEYGIVAPDKIEGVGEAKRASKDGPVPANEKYGDWLYSKRVKEGRKVLPGVEQVDALGYDKAVYFNRLAARYKDPNKAIVSLVREDGTEKTLADLRRDYKFKKVVRPSEPTIVIKNQKQLDKLAKNIRAAQDRSFTVGNVHSTSRVEAYAEKFGGVERMTVESLKNLEEEGGLTAQNSRKMRKFLEKSSQVNNFAMSGERWSKQQVGRYSKKVIEDQFKAVEKAFNTYPDSLDFQSSSLYFEYTKKAIKEGKGPNYTRVLKNMLKPCGKTYAGYTTTCSSVVNTKLKETSRLLSKKDIKKFRKAAKGVLDPKSRDLSDSVKEYIFSQKKLPSVSAAQDRDISWLSTMIHEIGHQVHFKGSGAEHYPFRFSPKDMTYVTKYASKNRFEQFAEAFTVYILDPEGLKLKAPKLYQWVDDNLEKALKLL